MRNKFLKAEFDEKLGDLITCENTLEEYDLKNVGIPYLYAFKEDEEFYVLKFQNGFIKLYTVYVYDDQLGENVRKLSTTEIFEMTEKEFEELKEYYNEKIQELLSFRLTYPKN